MSRPVLFSMAAALTFWCGELSAAWSSGGGGLFKDANNPWFVQNTDRVAYCISIDSSQSSLSEEQVDKAFRKAVAYWQHEFSFTNFAVADVIISTQTFVKVDCSPHAQEEADLVLQVGFLTYLQKREIKSYTNYASLAVRTQYDAEKLRARGFIYLAPEQSLSKMPGYELTEQAWSGHDQLLLQWTLAHELGHVFGLQHTGQTPSARTIMSHGFVEFILQKRNQLLLYSGSRSFFQIHPQQQLAPELNCFTQVTPTLRMLQQYFGIPANYQCFGTWLRDLSLEIWAAPDTRRAGEAVRVGTIYFDQERKEGRPAMTVWLPAEQKVVARKDYQLLPSYVVRNIKGRYLTAQPGIERKLGLVLDPTLDSPLLNDLRIIAEFNGVNYMDLVKGF